MKIVSGKNTIIILAALLTVAFGYLALSSIKKPASSSATKFEKEIINLETQSSSDEVASIERDLQETNLSGIDKELQDIERELEAAY